MGIEMHVRGRGHILQQVNDVAQIGEGEVGLATPVLLDGRLPKTKCSLRRSLIVIVKRKTRRIQRLARLRIEEMIEEQGVIVLPDGTLPHPPTGSRREQSAVRGIGLIQEEERRGRQSGVRLVVLVRPRLRHYVQE